MAVQAAAANEGNVHEDQRCLNGCEERRRRLGRSGAYGAAIVPAAMVELYSAGEQSEFIEAFGRGCDRERNEQALGMLGRRRVSRVSRTSHDPFG